MNPTEEIITSAPGKLFLIGEYAVLENAPAILAAVDRRARVRLTDSSDDCWHFSAPNLNIEQLTLGADGRPRTDNMGADLLERLRVFEAVRAHVTAYLEGPLPPLDIQIDTTDFSRDGHKLGLGSSAAVAAALTCALLARAGATAGREQIAQLAIRAHRDAQNGTGSGGDVATAVYGGLISYTRDHPPIPLTWPTGLSGVPVVTGTGADTTDLVGRVQAYRDNSPEGFASDMARLASLADQAAGDLDLAVRFVQNAREYFEALIALDQHAAAGIVTSRHHELHAMAAQHGALFKSSGAGGGDVGLLFATSAIDHAALYHAFDSAGASVIQLEFAAPGVTIETKSTQVSVIPPTTTGHSAR